ncbi:molybdenum cofactor guanylyltransferase [Pseudotenacibaculum haliotis]|uniref:Probable molybdenum cofactor guanylyltransferase n=1 Tax=Pseudotenacibaculum haliotis TaxID=1862138 RepID=A0ABW5LQY1_9FLAO
MKKHQKHTNLSRRNNGIYAPNELSILGAKCSIISDIVHQVSESLSQYKLAYFDASHAKDVEENILSDFTFHHEGNLSITTSGPINKYVQRIQFSQFDYVFINGNHYAGEKQVILLDPEKEASINKRIDQITDVQFFVKLTDDIEPFSSLKEKFPNWEEIPQYGINDIIKITEHISKLVSEIIPSIKGLVLTGGKSTRMGQDKSQLEYHGKPQKEFVRDLLMSKEMEAFYSVRDFSTPLEMTSGNSEEIPDAFFNLGPFGGICSAFQKDPNSAWFVLATDLPFVNDELIELLLNKRNPAKVATAVIGKGKQFPEPLITIYEPKAYPVLLQYLAQGYSCPRKMLINSDVELVEVENDFIRNINTPEEYDAAKEELA